MAELRYNPYTKDWIMIASHRQERPQMPKDWCPFCPGSGKVPDEGYTVLRYPNDFPAMSVTPPEPDDVATELFQTRPAYGRCEVLLYSPEHTKTLAELSDEHVRHLADLWRECFDAMAADEKIRCVFLFENRGEPVGVTMPHPHGQAYGYSFVPRKLAAELSSAREHKAQTGRCLFCDVLAEERKDGRRILFENEHFVVYVPFFSQVAYGVHVMAKRHVPHIGAMTKEELACLGTTVRDCAGMYDHLFDMPFPYMMCMHNAPVHSGDDVAEVFHFHIEFYPPMRAADKQQFFASSETGAEAWCNPTRPEEKAEELRTAYQRYLAEQNRKG